MTLPKKQNAQISKQIEGQVYNHTALFNIFSSVYSQKLKKIASSTAKFITQIQRKYKVRCVHRRHNSVGWAHYMHFNNSYV
uniref:Uncharacterized protein n=1 Tax=Arundo donax TaxID=35708 RepID=A0A0A9E300_ARUDO